jgi:hypothetical protein
MTEFGTFAARLVDGEPVVDRADDLIEVSGELAEMLGVKPPLDGRITLGSVEYDLGSWTGTGLPGRIPGTYVGRRVAVVVPNPSDKEKP